MRVSDYQRLQKAAKKGAPWESLRALVGAPKSTRSLPNCSMTGTDRVHLYPKVVITTYTPAGGTEKVTQVATR